MPQGTDFIETTKPSVGLCQTCMPQQRKWALVVFLKEEGASSHSTRAPLPCGGAVASGKAIFETAHWPYTVPISISGLKVPSQATRHTMIIATENSMAMLRRSTLTAPLYSPLWIDRAKSGLK